MLGLVVFRLVDGDARAMALMESVNASGTAYLSHTKVEGRTALRLATGSWRTTDADVDRTWEALVALLPGDRGREAARSAQPDQQLAVLQLLGLQHGRDATRRRRGRWRSPAPSP